MGPLVSVGPGEKLRGREPRVFGAHRLVRDEGHLDFTLRTPPTLSWERAETGPHCLRSLATKTRVDGGQVGERGHIRDMKRM